MTISESSEDLRPSESSYRISSRWTQDELSMAVMGVKKFGKDFQVSDDFYFSFIYFLQIYFIHSFDS